MKYLAGAGLVITLTVLTMACRGGGGVDGTSVPTENPSSSTVSPPIAAGAGTSDDLTGIPAGTIIFNTSRDGNFEIIRDED